MQNNDILEVSKTPNFLLIIFFVELLFVLFFLLYSKEINLEIFYIVIPVTLFLIISHLKIRFNKDYLEYQLFPIHIKKRRINWNEIEVIQIIKIDGISDFLGWGLRYSRKYGTGYILGNDYGIFILLKNKQKKTFTIKNKENVKLFLDKNNINYIDCL